MPNRILREGIIDSERVNALSWPEEVFYRRLMSKVDDYGRHSAHPKLLRAALYPLQLDKVGDQDVDKWLAATQKAGLVRVYETGSGSRVLELLDFRQRTRAKASKHPPPDGQLPLPGPAPNGRARGDDGHMTVMWRSHAHGDGDGDGDGDAPTRAGARGGPAAGKLEPGDRWKAPALNPVRRLPEPLGGDSVFLRQWDRWVAYLTEERRGRAPNLDTLDGQLRQLLAIAKEDGIPAAADALAHAITLGLRGPVRAPVHNGGGGGPPRLNGRREESVWAMKTRLEEVNNRLEELTRPGGCAHPVKLEGKELREAQALHEERLRLRSRIALGAAGKEGGA